ncbi:hypothetical protein BKA64DRAFT_726260 [Cadophora sp. MPI-SDFR-AT-0126]|nr:hypothetical protein BKA64DRAFT_726260 [Leotiomycetes sp. MPI-SDFR-AT-0126]
MAADLLTEGKEGKVFLDRLRSSLTIEIKCRHPTTKQEVIVRVPEALACSLSSRFSKIVGTGPHTRRQVTVEELLGGQRSFEELEHHINYSSDRSILDYLTWFVQWLYTSKLNYNKHLRFFEMWLFASKIECPKLQNEAMRMLSRDALWRSNVSLEEKKRQYYFANSDFYENLMYCVDSFGYFEPGQKDGFDKDGKLDVSYWEGKRSWLFLLDCAAYFGPGDRRVRNFFGENESLDIQIIKRMIDLAKEGGDPCPWDANNIVRYLVAELVSERPVKEARSMLPPVRKHALSPCKSNESKKRPKLSTTPEQKMAVVEQERIRPVYPEPPLNSSQDEPA